jgi:hypothetical protein
MPEPNYPQGYMGKFFCSVCVVAFWVLTVTGQIVADCTQGQVLHQRLTEWAGRGGTLIVRGHCKNSVPTPVSFALKHHAIMRGEDGARIEFAGGGEQDGISFSGTENLLIEDLIFTAPAGYSNVHHGLRFSFIRATLKNLSFYGIAAATQEAAVVYVGDSADVRILDSKFRGCTSHSARISGVILADKYTRLIVRDTEFWDYGNLSGAPSADGLFWSKTAQAGAAWINIRSPHPAANINSFPSLNIATIAPVEISGCIFDEGASLAVAVMPNSSGPQVYWVRLINNVANVGLIGMYDLRHIKFLDIDSGATSWRPLGGNYSEVDAIHLSNVEHATIRNFWTDSTKSATRLTADAGVKFLRLINSRFTTIRSDATTECVQNDGPEVCSANFEQFIKDVFHFALGREANSQELTTWRQNLPGMAGVLVSGLFLSQEYAARHRFDQDFISDLYRTFFNREPDPGGLAFWLTRLSGGRPAVIDSFAQSIEFKSRVVNAGQ